MAFFHINPAEDFLLAKPFSLVHDPGQDQYLYSVNILPEKKRKKEKKKRKKKEKKKLAEPRSTSPA